MNYDRTVTAVPKGNFLWVLFFVWVMGQNQVRLTLVVTPILEILEAILKNYAIQTGPFLLQ